VHSVIFKGLFLLYPIFFSVRRQAGQSKALRQGYPIRTAAKLAAMILGGSTLPQRSRVFSCQENVLENVFSVQRQTIYLYFLRKNIFFSHESFFLALKNVLNEKKNLASRFLFCPYYPVITKPCFRESIYLFLV